MSKIKSILAFATLMLSGGAWADAGDVISINFYQADAQKVTTDQTTVAGTIPASAWCNVNAGRGGNTVSGSDLSSYNPVTGASTQTTLAYSQYFSEANLRQPASLITDSAYSYLKAALTAQMAGGYRGTAKVDITKIPYDKYDVVLYFFTSHSNTDAKDNGQQTSFHVSTTGTDDANYTQYTVGEDGAPVAGSEAWGRSSDRTFVLGQNTVKFTGLTASEFHFKHEPDYCQNCGLCAIQIINRASVNDHVSWDLPLDSSVTAALPFSRDSGSMNLNLAHSETCPEGAKVAVSKIKFVMSSTESTCPSSITVNGKTSSSRTTEDITEFTSTANSRTFTFNKIFIYNFDGLVVNVDQDYPITYSETFKIGAINSTDSPVKASIGGGWDGYNAYALVSGTIQAFSGSTYTATLNANTTFASIDFDGQDNPPSAQTPVELTINGDVTVTVDAATEIDSLTLKGSGNFKLTGSSMLTLASIDASRLNGSVTLDAGTAIPTSAPVRVGSTKLVYNYSGNTELNLTHLSFSGDFTKGGSGTASLTKNIASGTTLTVAAGTLKFATVGNYKMEGRLVVLADATLVSTKTDAFGIDTDNARADIYGTLNMNGTRWTLNRDHTNDIYFYPGSEVVGLGEGSNGAFDNARANKTNLHFVKNEDGTGGEVTFNTEIRFRGDNGNNAGMEIEEGMTVNYVNTVGFRTNSGTLNLTGAGNFVAKPGSNLSNMGTLNVGSGITATVNTAMPTGVKLVVNGELNIPYAQWVPSYEVSGTGTINYSGTNAFSVNAADTTDNIVNGTTIHQTAGTLSLRSPGNRTANANLSSIGYLNNATINSESGTLEIVGKLGVKGTTTITKGTGSYVTFTTIELSEASAVLKLKGVSNISVTSGVEGKVVATSAPVDGVTTYSLVNPKASVTIDGGAAVGYATINEALQAASEAVSTAESVVVTPLAKLVNGETVVIPHGVTVDCSNQEIVSWNDSNAKLVLKGKLLTGAHKVSVENCSFELHPGAILEGLGTNEEGILSIVTVDNFAIVADDDEGYDTISINGWICIRTANTPIVVPDGITMTITGDVKPANWSGGGRGSLIKSGTGSLVLGGNLKDTSTYSGQPITLEVRDGSVAKVLTETDSSFVVTVTAPGTADVTTDVEGKIVSYNSETKTYTLVDSVPSVVSVTINGETTGYPTIEAAIEAAANATTAEVKPVITLAEGVAVPAGFTKLEGGVLKACDYVVISPNAYVSDWQAYVTARQAMPAAEGLVLGVKNAAEIYTAYPYAAGKTDGTPRNAAESIHKWIGIMQKLGTKYFVLGGVWFDAQHPEWAANFKKGGAINYDTAIPGIVAKPLLGSTFAEYPSDLYFACHTLEGDAKYVWDSDANGVYLNASEAVSVATLTPQCVVSRMELVPWTYGESTLSYSELIQAYQAKLAAGENNSFSGNGKYITNIDFVKGYNATTGLPDIFETMRERMYSIVNVRTANELYIAPKNTKNPTLADEMTNRAMKENWEVSIPVGHGTPDILAYIDKSIVEKQTGLTKFVMANIPCQTGTLAAFFETGLEPGIAGWMLSNPTGGSLVSINNTFLGQLTNPGIEGRYVGISDEMLDHTLDSYVAGATAGEAWKTAISTYAAKILGPNKETELENRDCAGQLDYVISAIVEEMLFGDPLVAINERDVYVKNDTGYSKYYTTKAATQETTLRETDRIVFDRAAFDPTVAVDLTTAPTGHRIYFAPSTQGAPTAWKTTKGIPAGLQVLIGANTSFALYGQSAVNDGVIFSGEGTLTRTDSPDAPVDVTGLVQVYSAVSTPKARSMLFALASANAVLKVKEKLADGMVGGSLRISAMCNDFGDAGATYTATVEGDAPESMTTVVVPEGATKLCLLPSQTADLSAVNMASLSEIKVVMPNPYEETTIDMTDLFEQSYNEDTHILSLNLKESAAPTPEELSVAMPGGKDEGKIEITVQNPIKGLCYSIVAADSPEGFASEQIVAESERMQVMYVYPTPFTLTYDPAKKVQYFKVRVSPSANYGK